MTLIRIWPGSPIQIYFLKYFSDKTLPFVNTRINNPQLPSSFESSQHANRPDEHLNMENMVNNQIKENAHYH